MNINDDNDNKKNKTKKKRFSSDIGISTVNSWWQHREPGEGPRCWASVLRPVARADWGVRGWWGLSAALWSQSIKQQQVEAPKTTPHSAMNPEREQGHTYTVSHTHTYMEDTRDVYSVHMVQKQKRKEIYFENLKVKRGNRWAPGASCHQTEWLSLEQNNNLQTKQNKKRGRFLKWLLGFLFLCTLYWRTRSLRVTISRGEAPIKQRRAAVRTTHTTTRWLWQYRSRKSPPGYRVFIVAFSEV